MLNLPKDRCLRCGASRFRFGWQAFLNGVKHIRVECADCGAFVCYAPQTSECIRRAESSLWVNLRDNGDKVVGVFLGDPHPREVVWTGERYVDASTPEAKPSLKAGKKPSLRIAINLAVRTEHGWEVKALEQTAAFFKDVMKVDQKYSLDGWIFEIQRHGAAGDPKTTYSILPEEKITKAHVKALEEIELLDLVGLYAVEERKAASAHLAAQTKKTCERCDGTWFVESETPNVWVGCPSCNPKGETPAWRALRHLAERALGGAVETCKHRILDPLLTARGKADLMAKWWDYLPEVVDDRQRFMVALMLENQARYAVEERKAALSALLSAIEADGRFDIWRENEMKRIVGSDSELERCYRDLRDALRCAHSDPRGDDSFEVAVRKFRVWLDEGWR